MTLTGLSLTVRAHLLEYCLMTDTRLSSRPYNIWRITGWGAALSLLIAPLVAMRFTTEVNWTAGDFVFAAMLIGVPGLLFELAAHTSRHWAFRLGAAIGLLGCFFTVWSNFAVGIVGNEDNPVNLWFFGIVLIVLLGSAVARLRPRGMMTAMIATALAQGAVGLALLSAEVVVLPFTAIMMAAWVSAAALFHRAAEHESRDVSG